MVRHGARLRWHVVFASLAGLAAPPTARAVDGIRPRSLVVWEDTPCMTVVDRSVDPIVHLPYAVSFEDTEHTTDEVETGRRHQMIGLCRQHTPQTPMPVWLSQADVDDAATVDLVDPADVGPSEILDTMEEWADCALRIVPDAERRPITNAAAAEGVYWDTTGVARGAWVVEGYTWDPAFNQWSPRPGVIAVYDDAAAPDNPPAAAITTGETLVGPDQAAIIEGCVVAGPGSTLRAQWAVPAPGDQQVWQTFVEDLPVEGTSFTVEFVPPAEVVGGSANIRVELVDGMGQSYMAYMVDQVTVIPGGSGGCAESGGGFLEDPGCEASSTSAADSPSTTDASGTSGTADGTGSSSEPGIDDPPEESCSCRAPREDERATGWLVIAAVACLRRRRR